MKKLYFCKQLVAETDRKTADYQDVRDWLRHDTPRDNIFSITLLIDQFH